MGVCVVQMSHATMITAADALNRLAEGRHSGALAVPGTPGGTVYVVDGLVTFIESAGAPDVESRLVQSGLISEADWREIIRASGAGGNIGEALLSRRLIRRTELLRLLRSVVFDAAVPLLGGDSAWDFQGLFDPIRRHWASALFRTDAGELIGEARRRTAALSRFPIGADDGVALRQLAAGGVSLDAGQWRIVAMINGMSTPRALAWQSGQELFGTTATVAALISQGACTIASGAAESVHPTAGGTPRVMEADPTPAMTPLPRRDPGGTRWADAEGQPYEPDAERAMARLPDPRTIRRVLDALREMR